MRGNLATDWGTEWKPLLWVVAVFVGAYGLPIGSPRFDGAVVEALALTKWYAQEHVLLCLVPAFFIAGAISVFLNQQAVPGFLSGLWKSCHLGVLAFGSVSSGSL